MMPALKRQRRHRDKKAAKPQRNSAVLAMISFIASAVREGRTVYDNIKSHQLTLPTNAGEAMTIIVGAVRHDAAGHSDSDFMDQSNYCCDIGHSACFRAN